MPAKTPSPTRKSTGAPVTLHPTVLSVIYTLYHLPAIRCAVWECNTVPEATKCTPAVELQPHKFVRVLQQLFLKIHRNEPWSVADMDWSKKIVGIPGHVCFDICRNYMVCDTYAHVRACNARWKVETDLFPIPLLASKAIANP